MSSNQNFDSFSTVLITGAGGGLGKALAQLMLAKGKRVILAGRTESNLQRAQAELAGSSSGGADARVEYEVVDLQTIQALPEFVEKLVQKYPGIDGLVLNAGVQKVISYSDAKDEDAVSSILKDSDTEITTNIISVVHLATLLLPHLLAKKSSAIFTVSSGLAFVPLAPMPVYCATKESFSSHHSIAAFIHSWSMTLRHQLQSSGVRVVEIAPPLVGTDLHRDHNDPDNNKPEKNEMSISVEKWIDEVEKLLDQGKDEIAVGFAGIGSGKWHDAFGEQFKKMNSGPH